MSEHRGRSNWSLDHGRTHDHLQYVVIEFGSKMGSWIQMRHPPTSGTRMCARFWGRSKDWKTLSCDDDVVYDKVIRMDVSDLARWWLGGPILLWEWTSRPLSRDSRHEWWTGLSLYGSRTWPKTSRHNWAISLSVLVPMRVSVIWVGSQVSERQKIAPNLTAIVVPGSRPVKQAAEKLGLRQDYHGCGLWNIRDPGCSMCLEWNPLRFQMGSTFVPLLATELWRPPWFWGWAPISVAQQMAAAAATPVALSMCAKCQKSSKRRKHGEIYLFIQEQQFLWWTIILIPTKSSPSNS